LGRPVAKLSATSKTPLKLESYHPAKVSTVDVCGLINQQETGPQWKADSHLPSQYIPSLVRNPITFGTINQLQLA